MFWFWIIVLEFNILYRLGFILWLLGLMLNFYVYILPYGLNILILIGWFSFSCLFLVYRILMMWLFLILYISLIVFIVIHGYLIVFYYFMTQLLIINFILFNYATSLFNILVRGRSRSILVFYRIKLIFLWKQILYSQVITMLLNYIKLLFTLV